MARICRNKKIYKNGLKEHFTEVARDIMTKSLAEVSYYDRLYEACSPRHFKDVKYFSPDGRKNIPNGHSIQRGGFINECKENLNNFVLSEAVRYSKYGSRKYRGGVIIFSTELNAVGLDKNAIKNKVDTIIFHFQQRFFSGKKNSDIFNKAIKYFRKMSEGTIGAYSIGNTFKGKYIGDNYEEYNERSISIEVNGLSNKALLYLGEMIARAFYQETVLIKDLNKNKIYFTNGLRIISQNISSEIVTIYNEKYSIYQKPIHNYSYDRKEDSDSRAAE